MSAKSDRQECIDSLLSSLSSTRASAKMTKEPVTTSDLYTPTNSPSNLQSTLKTPDGQSLSERQAKHLAIVLDLFQAKGTMAKMNDNFTPDAVYEDLFASCKNRDEIAGQMVNLPTVVKDTTTHKLDLQSITRQTTTDGRDKSIEADELKLGFNHTFQFRTPLPKGASKVTMDTTLFIYSTDQGIVRFSDRPQGNIPGNALLSFMRKMNAVGVPKVVGLPKNDEEDAKKVLKEQR